MAQDIEQINEDGEEAPDDEVRELMEAQGVHREIAERVRDIMDECGVDEDDAMEIEESI